MYMFHRRGCTFKKRKLADFGARQTVPVFVFNYTTSESVCHENSINVINMFLIYRQGYTNRMFVCYNLIIYKKNLKIENHPGESIILWAVSTYFIEL